MNRNELLKVVVLGEDSRWQFKADITPTLWRPTSLRFRTATVALCLSA
jgi:hypothetical protein